MENKNKMEVMSNELAEISNIIAIAKADSEIEQVLLSEIAREFDLKNVSKTVFFQDTVFEIIELAEHDDRKKQMFFKTLLESKLGQGIQDHFYEYFASNGQIRE